MGPSRYLDNLVALHIVWIYQRLLPNLCFKPPRTLIDILNVLLVSLPRHIKHFVEVGPDSVNSGGFDILSFAFGGASIVVQAF